MALALALVSVLAVVCGYLVAALSPSIRNWLDSRAELNRARARALGRPADDQDPRAHWSG
jgi:hypothetical protein